MGTAQTSFPPQHQNRQPGLEKPMHPAPESDMTHYTGSGKLAGQVAIVTGGDSGIGRAVAIGFAKEGADVVIVYLNETEDADHTCEQVRATGAKCHAIMGDIGDEAFAKQVVDETIEQFNAIDVLVNNAAEQHPQARLEDLSRDQLERTFRTNLFAMFDLVRYALPHMKAGASVINTTSVTAYKGNAHLVDYSATKGAIVAFTRSLALQLSERGIRVNAVAPGPIWTPLIPSTFDAEHVARFGSEVPMQRAGQPDEVAPSFIFLASRDAAYMSGQVLHPNGGVPING